MGNAILVQQVVQSGSDLTVTQIASGVISMSQSDRSSVSAPDYALICASCMCYEANSRMVYSLPIFIVPGKAVQKMTQFAVSFSSSRTAVVEVSSTAGYASYVQSTYDGSTWTISFTSNTYLCYIAWGIKL